MVPWNFDLLLIKYGNMENYGTMEKVCYYTENYGFMEKTIEF